MDGAREYVRQKGDDEMGGGPVKVDAKVKLWPDGRKLVRGNLEIRLEEDKKDRSTYVYFKQFNVFDLVQAYTGQTNPLEECRVATGKWTKLQPVSGTDVYGSLVHRTRRDERWVNMSSNNRGLINGLTCMVDGEGRDDRVRCDPPRLVSIYVTLVNALDEEAEQWAPPRQTRVAPKLPTGLLGPR